MIPNSVTDLAFEAQFFGGPVWRLDDLGNVSAVVKAAGQQGVKLISYRTGAGNANADRLEGAGFRHVETLVTLERPLREGQVMPDGVRLASASDESACAEIGRSAFTFDRFHADPVLPDEPANALKAEWLRNAVRGRADVVFVAEDEDGRVVGCNACLKQGEAAVIDLIGVLPGLQGQGIGTRLLQAMDAHYAGCARILRLGTQADNAPSLAFYRKQGFKAVDSRQAWHWTPQG